MRELEPAEGPRPSRTGLWASLGAGALLVLSKLKGVLVLLKALPFAKFGLTSLSMIAAMWFQAVRFGWPYGVGFILLILVHELGHAYAIKDAGLSAGWPVFIPGFGAMIALKKRPTPLVDAYTAYAGPVAGTAAALLCAAVYLITHQPLFLALANAGFFLNLFNLLPIRPLDGGSVAELFHRRAGIVGAILLGVLFLVTHAPQLLLIAAMAAFAGRGQPVESAVPVTEQERRTWAIRDFGLCIFLGAALRFTHDLLERSGP